VEEYLTQKMLNETLIGMNGFVINQKLTKFC